MIFLYKAAQQFISLIMIEAVKSALKSRNITSHAKPFSNMEIKLFVWLFVIVVTNVTAEIFPPRLVDVPQDHFVVQSGDNFKLRCESSKPVNWTYPVLDGTKRKSTVLIKDTMSEDSDYPYVSTLEMDDAYFMDTGYYSCFFEGATDIQNSDVVSKVYVFVNDSANLLVTDELFVVGQEHKSVVIPCRPTTPDVEVTLFDDYDEVVTLDDGRVTFDPKIGFQIDSLTIEDSSSFHCQAKRDDVTEIIDIFLHILTTSSFVEAPRIKLDTENSENHVEVGSWFSLNCSASVAHDIKFKLKWDVPNNVAVKEGRLTFGHTIIQNKGSEIKAHTILNVHDARYIDSGAYTCTILDHNGNQNATTFDISVFDKDANYISINAQENKLHESTIAFVGNVVKWVVHFKSNPIAKVTWFDSRRKTVTPYSKVFKITNTKNSTTLQISNVTFFHSGVYTLELDNSKERRIVQRKLQVSGAPVVLGISSGSTTQIRADKSLYTLDCKIMTNLKPTTVEWVFKKCFHFSNCSAENIKLNGFSIKNGSSPYEIVSQIMVNTSESGYVTCKAANEVFGVSNTVSFPFFVTDLVEAVEVRSNPKLPAIGREIILSCRISKFKFHNRIQWFKNDELLNEPLVINTDNRHSYGRNIVVKKLSRKDFGTYICTAMDINNETRSSTVTVNVITEIPLGAKIVLIAVSSAVILIVFILFFKIFKSTRKVTLLSTAISKAKQSRNEEIIWR